jgi:hypothetical protein
MPLPRLKVSAAERRAIRDKFRDEFLSAKRAGKSDAAANKAATAAVKEQFGALDWAVILPIILQLLPILLELFKK